jgi:hypothetical protein
MELLKKLSKNGKPRNEPVEIQDCRSTLKAFFDSAVEKFFSADDEHQELLHEKE